jgi:hypothetical protein
VLVRVSASVCVRVCVTEDYVYTERTAPTGWLAPEVFVPSTRDRAGKVATAASDVFMLGCCYLELATKCTRTPYDWLSGFALTVYRGHDSTRAIGPIQVTRTSMLASCCCLLSTAAVWCRPLLSAAAVLQTRMCRN